MRIVLVCAALLAVLVVPVTLHAQGREDASLEFRLVMSSTLTTSMSPTISLLFIERGIKKEKEQLEEEIEHYEQFVLIEHYMKESHADVMDAVTLGDGEALRDLSIILHISEEDYASWSTQVRKQKQHIFRVLALPRGSEQARQLHHILTHAASPHMVGALSSSVQQEVSP